MSKPKKALAQHWLNDETSLQAMIKRGQVREGDRVLEIGPGLGSLTAKLLKTGAQVTAVEYDQELAEKLSATLNNPDNLEVIHQDILDFDLSKMDENYKVIANIPYYLTGKLLRKLFDATSPPIVTSLLVQKEVAERLAAKPGKMSILSVVAQHYCLVSLAEIIPAELFNPAPKVDSQIVVLKRREQIRGVDIKKFMRLIKAGFSKRRKKLSNSLSGGLQLEKQQVENILEEIGVDKDVRAQELSTQKWYEVYDLLINQII